MIRVLDEYRKRSDTIPPLHCRTGSGDWPQVATLAARVLQLERARTYTHFTHETGVGNIFPKKQPK